MASHACISIPTKVLPDCCDDPLSPEDANSLVLQVDDDVRIVMTTGMVRILASMAPTTGLLGSTTFEEAQIEGWISYLWHSVELPLYVLSENTSQQVSNHILSQVQVALVTIESHLKHQKDSSCLVGESISIADITLAVTLKFNDRLLHDILTPDSFLRNWLDKIDGECHLSEI